MSRAIALFGTDEPVPAHRLLRAGALTAVLDGTQLRWIEIGGLEVIRGIAFVVRDGGWGTCAPKILDLAVEEDEAGFRIALSALCRLPDGDLPWTGHFEGRSDGTLACTATATPARALSTCRTGFVVLHPIEGVAGRPMRIEHPDGTTEDSEAPDLIDPAPCFTDIRAMSHEPRPGLRVSVRLDGDVWETEDQRNWTDASFKTYSRPLRLGFPYTLTAGEPVTHRVTLRVDAAVSAPAIAPPGPAPLRLRIGESVGTMPAVGLSLLPENAEAALAAADRLAEVAPAHLAVRLDLRRPQVKAALAAGARLAERAGAALVLEIVLPGLSDPDAELADLARAVRTAGLSPALVMATPAADLRSYPPGQAQPAGVPAWATIAAALRKAFPDARIAGGMLANFTELNRKRPPPGLFDAVTHATSALVHAADDRSVMETLETLPWIVRSTRAFLAETPYRIGPMHIGNSFNPYGADVAPNPHNGRVPMARIDPRQRGLFAAAWHLGAIACLAPLGLEALTLASPIGEFGLVHRPLPHAQPGYDGRPDVAVYPAFHVMRGMARARGRPLLAVTLDDPSRVAAIAFGGPQPEIWIANLREAPVEVDVAGPGGPWRLWRMDEDSFARAIRDPRDGDRIETHAALPIALDAYAIARLTRA